MRKLVVGLLLCSSTALAQQAFDREDFKVSIDGETYYTGLIPFSEEKLADIPYVTITPREDLPEAYDAREDGLVTPAKNQGNCGSCWAFARTKAFEAALIKAGKADVALDLAEQDTLVNDRYSYGCNGGFMDGRFEVNYGQTTEDLCPYRASARYACRAEKFGKATRWAMIGSRNRAPSVDELRQAIYDYGVIAVTVAAGSSFRPNSEGRITTCGSTSINHMVTLAGWRPAENGGYEFLIGNSWGENWGIDGFAWSKQGCNRLASAAGQAALFFYVEPETN